jgi:hypothetical protein
MLHSRFGFTYNKLWARVTSKVLNKNDKRKKKNAFSRTSQTQGRTTRTSRGFALFLPACSPLHESLNESFFRSFYLRLIFCRLATIYFDPEIKAGRIIYRLNILFEYHVFLRVRLLIASKFLSIFLHVRESTNFYALHYSIWMINLKVYFKICSSEVVLKPSCL